MVEGLDAQESGDPGAEAQQPAVQEPVAEPVVAGEAATGAPEADVPEPETEFSKLLQQQESGNAERALKGGEKVSGVLVKIGDENSFIDFGGRSEGVIKTAELKDEDGSVPFSEGDPLEVFVVSDGEEIVLTRSLGGDDVDSDQLQQAYQNGIPIEGKVEAVNKWGLGVSLAGDVRAFCPISQIDTQFVKETEPYRDQSFSFKIIEYRNGGRNIVVSRRALLEADEKKVSDEVRAGLKKGAEIEGTVTRLQPFGAFVALGGGVEGLIHVSEMSFQRVKHPSEVLREGQQVKVTVIELKHLGSKKKERISLSLKALEEDPWDEVVKQFKPGTVVEGKVEALEEYGVFVELAPNVRGLAHISELSDKRVNHPKDVVSVGETVRVAIVEMDNKRRRLRLSLKQAERFESSTNLKEFQQRQEKTQGSQGTGAMFDALQRANLIDKQGPAAEK
jgi:small subunit ribosomal protein S1